MDTDTESLGDESRAGTDLTGDGSGHSATGEGAESAAAEPAIAISGRQAVVGIYLVAVGLAAGFGFALALTIDAGTVAAFGPITFQISPLNLALYGAVSVGVGLGAFVGLAALVASRHS